LGEENAGPVRLHERCAPGSKLVVRSPVTAVRGRVHFAYYAADRIKRTLGPDTPRMPGLRYRRLRAG